MNQFKLPLTRDEILKLEDNYKKSNEIQQEERVMAIAVQAKERGFLTKEEFLEIGKWKTPRQNKNYANNDEEFIKEVTSVSFSGKASDELRIHVLTLLGGVNLRVASAILHLAFLPEKQTYPIMDVRALQTLGYKAKSEKEFNKMSKNEKIDFLEHAYRRKDGSFLEPCDEAKFLNHSCNSNILDTGKGFDIAVRNIKKGEEATYDYRVFYDDLNMPCSCGEVNCCKIVTCKHPVPKELEQLWSKKINFAFKLLNKVSQPLKINRRYQ